MNTPQIRKWYGYGWVWFVLLIPFSAVLFGIFMIIAATQYPDDTVVDNYYKEGLAINKKFSTRSSGYSVNVYRSDQELKTMIFDFIPSVKGAVRLNVFHVTNKTKDMSVVLSQDSDGTLVSHDSFLYSTFMQPGVWYLEFVVQEFVVKDFVNQEGTWRLNKRLVTPPGLREG